MIVAPRPPHRSHSHSSASISAALSSGKHVSVERLRHSISVARGHSSINSVTGIVAGGNSGGSSSGSGGARSSADSRPSPFTMPLTEQASYHSGRAVAGAAGLGGAAFASSSNIGDRAMRRHSSSGGVGSGAWTGAQSPSDFSVSTLSGNTTSGSSARNVTGEGEVFGSQHRGSRPQLQQVF